MNENPIEEIKRVIEKEGQTQSAIEREEFKSATCLGCFAGSSS